MLFEAMQILSLHISNTTNTFISCGLQKKGFFLSTRFQVFCLQQKTKPDQVLEQTEHIHFFTIFEPAFEATSQLTVYLLLVVMEADSFHAFQF